MALARQHRDEPDRLERIVEVLRRDGGRLTASRRVIVAALLDAPHHVTADELTALVQRTHPEIAPSTIYRTLNTLDELGVVSHVHIGHGPMVYHPAEARHNHLVCRRCDVVVEVPDSKFEVLASELRSEYDFVIDPHHVALSGVCAACRDT